MEEHALSSIPIQDTTSQPQHNSILNKRNLLLMLSILLLVLIPVGIFFFINHNTPSVIAYVNNEPVYTRYLEKEIELYPEKPTAEIKHMLTKKIIDDQIALQAAKKENLIKAYNTNTTLTTQEYVQRTDQVQEIKREIEETANSISGSWVSVWIYNNGYIGPQGFGKGKQIAYTKIKPLYDKVKKGELTMKEAGAAIAATKSLKDLDPSWEVNAYAPFTYYQGNGATFWPEFNTMLWGTKPGEITPLYLGRGRDKNGVMRDELYIFGKIDKKITDKNYNGYIQWLKEQKKHADVVIPTKNTGYLLEKSVPVALAQEDGGNSSNDNGSNSNNGGEDNGPPGIDRHGLADWIIDVVSQTGAPVKAKRIRFKNTCTTEEWKDTESVGFGPEYKYGCGCNTQTFSAYVRVKDEDNMTTSSLPKAFAQADRSYLFSEQECGSQTIKIQNGDEHQHHTIVCKPPDPKITNTPKLSCGQACTAPGDCMDAKDGCSVCSPNAAGGKVCSPPACGVACQRTDQCAGAKDGCTACVDNKCQTAVLSCGAACTSQNDCTTVKDGCTTCSPNEKGADVCKAADADICKCDGIDLNLTNGKTGFFPGDVVNFTAYAKILDADTNRADIESMTFSLYQSDAANLNNATRLAESTAIKPEIISKTNEQTRYKVSWNRRIPLNPPVGSLFRIQATIECAAKSAAPNANGVLADTDNQQQADIFTPGGQIVEKSCTFLKFKFD